MYDPKRIGKDVLDLNEAVRSYGAELMNIQEREGVNYKLKSKNVYEKP